MRLFPEVSAEMGPKHSRLNGQRPGPAPAVRKGLGMRSWLRLLLLALIVYYTLAPAAAAPPGTPLLLTAAGTLTQEGAVLPWPADPGLWLALGVRLHTVITASSPTANAAAVALVSYFNAASDDDGFMLLQPGSGPTVVAWHGQWTNQQGFLIQGDVVGQRTAIVSQTPPVVALAGAAAIQGLSGRGRGIVVNATWAGQLNTQTGALTLVLTGSAVGALGPPPVVCGDYTDAGLAGDLQPLMLHPDGTPNRDHFSHDASDPYPHPFPYSTNPPTSGPHNPSPLPWGIDDTPQDDESLVHNLEHGGVIVSYQPSLAPALVARLRALVALYPADVILTPRPANDVPIALTSWGRLQKFTDYDEPAIQSFIDRNRGHGPECFD